MDEKFSITPYLNDLEIIRLTTEQIKKDFSFFNLTVNFSGDKNSAYEELSSQIEPLIKKLMDEDYEKFLSLLYRIDIQESNLNRENTPQNITGLIIKRCLQKVILRKYFSK